LATNFDLNHLVLDEVGAGGFGQVPQVPETVVVAFDDVDVANCCDEAANERVERLTVGWIKVSCRRLLDVAGHEHEVGVAGDQLVDDVLLPLADCWALDVCQHANAYGRVDVGLQGDFVDSKPPRFDVAGLQADGSREDGYGWHGHQQPWGPVNPVGANQFDDNAE
jgi:hypothetical protein